MQNMDRRTMLSAIAAAVLAAASRASAAPAYPALSKMPAARVPAPVDVRTPAAYLVGDPAWDAAPLATTVVFDDFTGPAGSQPSTTLWQIDTVNQGGIQTYTTSTANVFLDGQSHLVIQAISDGNGGWTSGHVTSRQRFNMGYGLTEASIQFPEGNGLLPAFWMLGVNYPNCAELDIMEVPGNGNTYFIDMTEWATPWIGAQSTGSFGVDLCEGFHTYWCNRTPGVVRFGIDDQTLANWTEDWLYANDAGGAGSGATLLPAGTWALFEQPLYAIMNVAVNTGWGPDADSTTPSPSAMLVDWFRFTPS